MGLGLVTASLLPGLALGARDIGVLRSTGCAGGYMLVFAQGKNSALNEVQVTPGQTLNLQVRVGGYTPQSHPGPFQLDAATQATGLTLRLPKKTVRAGETVPLQITAARGIPVNTYTVNLRGVQGREGRTYEAAGTLTVGVKPEPE